MSVQARRGFFPGVNPGLLRDAAAKEGLPIETACDLFGALVRRRSIRLEQIIEGKSRDALAPQLL